MDYIFRHIDFIDPDRLTTPITVVGAGGIGSQAVLALAKIGYDNITVYDYDMVDEVNIGNSFLSPKGIDKPKVENLKELVKDMTGVEIKAIASKVEHDHLIKEFPFILISAVDNMSTRRGLYQFYRDYNVEAYIDGRMAGLRAEVYALTKTNPLATDKYKMTLVNEEEAEEGKCTAKTIIYNTMFIGSIIAQTVNEVIISDTAKPSFYKLTADLKNMMFAIERE